MNTPTKIYGPHAGSVTTANFLAQSFGVGLRAPHHAVDLMGAAEEAARAAGGVLLLEDITDFDIKAIRMIARLVAINPPRAIVVTADVLHWYEDGTVNAHLSTCLAILGFPEFV